MLRCVDVLLLPSPRSFAAAGLAPFTTEGLIANTTDSHRLVEWALKTGGWQKQNVSEGGGARETPEPWNPEPAFFHHFSPPPVTPHHPLSLLIFSDVPFWLMLPPFTTSHRLNCLQPPHHLGTFPPRHLPPAAAVSPQTLMEELMRGYFTEVGARECGLV